MRTSRAGLKLIVVVVVVVVVPVTNPLFERDKLIQFSSLSSSSLYVGRKEVLFRNYSAPWYKARLLKHIMPRAIATFNGQIIAEADTYEQVEGNVYFPPESIKNKHALSDAELTTFCPWKGTASYYNITVDGNEAKDAAWYYPQPKTGKAEKIKDHVAFYKSKVDVKVD